MSRVQLALNVSNIDDAVAFYSKLFGADPAKRRPGYANFAIVEPPLKLVLIETDRGGGSINHLGVEVEDQAEVQKAIDSFGAKDLATDTEIGVSCCYAVQDKVWVTDPDGAKWEVYTVLGEAPTMGCSTADADGMCLGTTAEVAGPEASESCCTPAGLEPAAPVSAAQ